MIVFLEGARSDSFDLGVLLTAALDHLLDVGVGNLVFFLGDVETLITLHVHLGAHLEVHLEDQVPAALALDELPARLGNRDELFGLQGFLKSGRDQVINDVTSEICVGNVLLGHFRRHFATPEARESQPLGCLSESPFVGTLDLLLLEGDL